MATERMIHFPFGQSRAQNCSKMGSMMYGWSAGTETLLRDSGSVENSPMIEYTAPVYMLMRSLLAQALSLPYGELLRTALFQASESARTPQGTVKLC
jgi:hypothetical protein